jgi:hypothetical protein
MALVHSLTPAERKEKKIFLKNPPFWLKIFFLSSFLVKELVASDSLYPGSFLLGAVKIPFFYL